ncbi:PIG-L family deacetylase [Kribbella sp. DT2]|uniref:PIG-L family deacetylase n=1 Tax=Kribbella sp. DT2 TaxID=3393427 RepID=UPI003CEE747C
MTRALTGEDQWVEFFAARELPVFDATAPRRVVVLAAHPDDETLGVGGTVQALHAAGADVTVVVASDGEAAFPALGAADRADLAARRRDELATAMDVLGSGKVEVSYLGLPDSGLAECEDELRELLVELLRGADCVLLPWTGDPHPDHAAVGRAGLAAAPVEAHRWSYPVWMWHWMTPYDERPPWARAVRMPLPERLRVGKEKALAAFVSQLVPGPNGEDPIVDPLMLTHFDRDFEVLFREPRTESAPVERFAELYRAADDPWHTADSWYERRKRAVLLAALPLERYRRVLEPACGVGELTRELVDRADQVLAFDPVPEAVERARQAAPAAEVVVAALPLGPPLGSVDLVVLSEILYYLDDAALTATLDVVLAALEPGGDLIAVHWRPWAPEAPRDGDAAHRIVLARDELEVLVEHVEDDFVLHVLRRR